MNATAKSQDYDTSSPLYRTVSTTPTDYWNDSCSSEELAYAIRNGAVGATTNPSIVLNVLKKEFSDWKDTLAGIIEAHPTEAEDQIAWRLIEAMGVKGAAMLMPIFERE